MATPPENTKESNTEKLALFKIPETFQYADCYGTGSIYSQRVGYTILQPMDYVGEKPNSTFIAAGIRLPLPDSLILPASMNWSDVEEDGLADFASKMLKPGAGDAVDKTLGGAVGEVATRAIAKNFLQSGPAKAALRSLGLAYNPNKQLYFEGVALETMPLDFKLMPRSASEAYMMYSICLAILQGSLPGGGSTSTVNEIKGALSNAWAALSGGKSQDPASTDGSPSGGAIEKAIGMSPFFQYPHLWNLGVFVTAKRGNTMKDACIFQWNKLAIESVRISFGADIKWHEDGYPTQVTMALQFHETEIRTADTLKTYMPTMIIPSQTAL